MPCGAKAHVIPGQRRPHSLEQRSRQLQIGDQPRRVLLLVSGFLVLLGSVVLFLQRLPLPARCAIAFIDYLGAAVLWVFRRQDYSDLDGA